jgi:outer membrane protein assembly factor BamB
MEKFLPTRLLRFALPSLIVALCATLAWSQVKIRAGFAVPVADAETKSENESKFGDGPGLKTDPEAQQLLQRAEQFVKDERYDLATVLWQKVLDDAGDNLVSVDGRLYISLRRQVEQRLATLPRLALQTYRVSADGEAQALIAAAGPEKEEEALSQVVRRFFMSSQGDDAAYKLACLALDRYDFVGASRLLAKVLDEHPDPSISRADLLIRQAIAAGRVGDRDGANKYLAQIDALDGPRPSRALLGAVVEDIKQTTAATQFVAARMAMPQLPADATSKTLTELWAYEYPMLFQEQPLNRNMAYAVYDGSGRQTFERRPIPRDQVIDRWKSSGWTPAGKLLFGDGRVYFKTNNNITCWSTQGDDKKIWASLWNNDFEIDEFSQQMVMMAINMGIQPGMQQDSRPRTPAEIQLFGDQIHQDMSLIGGKIYSIEGRKYPSKGQPEVTKAAKPFNYNATPRRSRVNYLSAYDARTGKVQWNRPADDEAKDGSDGGVGFMAAPTACGNVLLAPTTDGGSMWLYGISPDDGHTLWKTYLCDEPAGGCEPWSPMGVAVEGRDAYVLCGAGVVFAVDGTSGAIRWVVRYNRTPNKNPSGRKIVRNPYGGGSRLEEYSGWSEDKLIAVGRQLIVMASDCDWLLCLDCRTGDKLWDSPRTSPVGPAVDYCLGVKGRGLFVAGKTSVRRYDIPTGKFNWEYPGKNDPPMESFGRGVLTDDAVYVPVKDSVLKLTLDKQDPDKSQAMSQVGVRLTTPDPVGNLYSDGEKMWVLSANRIYSLTHLEYRMQALEKRIAAGDSAALLDRMRLLVKSEQWDAAMADLRAAFALIGKQQDRDAAITSLFGVIDELKLTAIRPSAVLDTLSQIFADESVVLKPDHRVKLDGLLSSSLASLPRIKSPDSVASALAAAPLYKQDFLVLSAARSVKAVAQASDKAALQQAVTAGKEPASLIAAEAWAILDPEAAKVALKPWLEKDDSKVKLLTARALLQAGDTSALSTLIDMLGGADIPLCNRAFQTLRGATGKHDLVYTAYAAAEERNKQIALWREWYDANKGELKLKLPLPDAGAQLGRTLICSQQRGRVVEIDSSGKEISSRAIPQCWSAKGLPNGNRLVAVTAQPGKVIEYDEQWKEVWSVDGLPAGVWSVDRSVDGATIIACPDAVQIIEVKAGTKEKKILWRGDGNSRPIFARRLESGNTLICLQQGLNKVIEIDGTGKQVWESSNLLNPFSAQRLENGNTLVAAMVNGRNGMIVELDAAGKQVKVHKQNIPQLYAAERLIDGSIMYCDQQGLYKLDAEGKTIYTFRQQNMLNITGFSNF